MLDLLYCGEGGASLDRPELALVWELIIKLWLLLLEDHGQALIGYYTLFLLDRSDSLVEITLWAFFVLRKGYFCLSTYYFCDIIVQAMSAIIAWLLLLGLIVLLVCTLLYSVFNCPTYFLDFLFECTFAYCCANKYVCLYSCFSDWLLYLIALSSCYYCNNVARLIL